MQQNLLIVVFGPPASGKTTLANRIAKQLPQSRVVSADCFEEYLRGHSKNELKEKLSNA
jgi:uridine kinase